MLSRYTIEICSLKLLEAFDVTEWELVLNPHEEEDEIMHLRRDEMAIRNMMQMKQAGI